MMDDKSKSSGNSPGDNTKQLFWYTETGIKKQAVNEAISEKDDSMTYIV